MTDAQPQFSLKRLAFVATAAGLLLAIGPLAQTSAEAQTRRADMTSLREAMAQGEVIPLGELVASVQRTAPYDEMRFLGGAELNPIQMSYKLRFLDGSRVVFVYVDARSGRVIGRSS